jgi:hypothetical protein
LLARLLSFRSEAEESAVFHYSTRYHLKLVSF